MEHANGATAAADKAAEVAAKAGQVEETARRTESESLASRTEVAVQEAREAKKKEDEELSNVAYDTLEQTRQDEETRRLLTEAAAPGTPDATVVSNGRKAAARLIKVAGPWTVEVALNALGGTDDQVRQFVSRQVRIAEEQDDRARVGYLADTTTNAPLNAAAETALNGDYAAVRTFLQTQQYEGKETDDRVRIVQLMESGGPATKAAGRSALEGSAEDRNTFLRTGQHEAAEIDNRSWPPVWRKRADQR